MNRAMLVILATVTLDAIGIGLIMPILPSLLRELTGSGQISILYGVLLAVYSAMQFLMGPVLGALSDRYGRRPVLLISLAGAAVDYLMMALTPFLWVVVAGRVIAGITAANFAVATSYIADVTPAEQRAQRFGFMHACFGIGFIVGPVMGGLLGEYWVRAPFLAAAALNAINFTMALFVLPESHVPEKVRFEWRTLNPFEPVKWVFAFKAILPLIGIFFLINFVGQVYGSIWVLFGEDRFEWSSTMVGLSLAGYGLFHALAQALLVGPVNKWLGERRTLVLGMALEGAAAIALAFMGQGWMVFVLLPFFAVAGVGLPALQSMISNGVDQKGQGRLQGVLTSLVSLAAVFGPLFFAGVYAMSKSYWDGTVWLVVAGIYLVAAVPVLWRSRRRVAV